MPLTHTVNLDGLTYGDLYKLADFARAAGIPESGEVLIETDEHGYPSTLSAELGDVEELSRCILIDRPSARDYAQALYNVLQRQEDKADTESLERLLHDLWELPHPSLSPDAEDAGGAS